VWALILLVFLVIGVGIVVVGADRYRPRGKSTFILPTYEVSVDPLTGARQRVYVDPATGERAYVDEPVPHPASPVPPLERPGFVGTPPVLYPPGAPGPDGGYLAPPAPPHGVPPALAGPHEDRPAG
jgi:hypothetical protein